MKPSLLRLVAAIALIVCGAAACGASVSDIRTDNEFVADVDNVEPHDERDDGDPADADPVVGDSEVTVRTATTPVPPSDDVAPRSRQEAQEAAIPPEAYEVPPDAGDTDDDDDNIASPQRDAPVAASSASTASPRDDLDQFPDTIPVGPAARTADGVVGPDGRFRTPPQFLVGADDPMTAAEDRAEESESTDDGLAGVAPPEDPETTFEAAEAARVAEIEEREADQNPCAAIERCRVVDGAAVIESDDSIDGAAPGGGAAAAAVAPASDCATRPWDRGCAGPEPEGADSWIDGNEGASGPVDDDAGRDDANAPQGDSGGVDVPQEVIDMLLTPGSSSAPDDADPVDDAPGVESDTQADLTRSEN